MPATVVLHRTRVDEQRRVVLTRLGRDFRPRWSTELPLAELQNRWEMGAQLLLFGSDRSIAPGLAGVSENIVALRLQDGSSVTWNIQAEAPPGGER